MLLGILILAGVFGISPQFKGILGVMLIGYGLIRFLLMKTRFQGYNVRRKKGLMEEKKKDDKSLRSL